MSIDSAEQSPEHTPLRISDNRIRTSDLHLGRTVRLNHCTVYYFFLLVFYLGFRAQMNDSLARLKVFWQVSWSFNPWPQLRYPDHSAELTQLSRALSAPCTSQDW